MSRPFQWLQTILEFIVDNWAFLLTIGFTAFVIYRQRTPQTAASTSELLTSILAVLSLLALSGLVERYRKLNKIQTSVEKLGRRISAQEFFRHYLELFELESYAQTATTIDLCGVSLTDTISHLRGTLKDRLGESANIRILIGDPEKVAEMRVARSGTSSLEYFRGRFDNTYNALNFLHKSWVESQTGHTEARRGSFTVKLLPFIPSFAMYGFDTDRPNGTILVRIYPHLEYRFRPRFDLTFHRDGEYYSYFREQFEQMWNHPGTKLWSPTSSSDAEAREQPIE